MFAVQGSRIALRQCTRSSFNPSILFAHIQHNSLRASRSSPFHQSSRRSAYSYQRFRNTSSLLQRWAASPTFYYQVAGLSGAVGVFYISNLEIVPVSGRRRFNMFGPEYEAKLAHSQASDILRMFGGEVLPDSDPRTRQVKRVMNRLIPVCGLNLDWEIYVVESELVNAMVVPGGKVFVFTGILPICKDDDGLAAVLGHEISHSVARHVSEKISRNFIFYGLAFFADVFLGTGVAGQAVIQYLFEMPNGRKQETEADYLGLMLMSQACYNPRGAFLFWQRMAATQQGRVAQVEFLSTHPASTHRAEQLKEWLPEAEEKRRQSSCGSVLDYADEFRKAIPQVRW